MSVARASLQSPEVIAAIQDLIRAIKGKRPNPKMLARKQLIWETAQPFLKAIACGGEVNLLEPAPTVCWETLPLPARVELVDLWRTITPGPYFWNVAAIDPLEWVPGLEKIASLLPRVKDTRRKLLIAISKKGKEAKPDVIIQAAKVNEQAGLESLRALQEEGKYQGFSEPESRR